MHDIHAVAEAVDGEASPVGGGQDELRQVAGNVIVEMPAYDVKPVVEQIHAGHAWVVWVAMVIETEVEGAVVDCGHAAAVGYFVEGVGAYMEGQVLEKFTLGVDVRHPQLAVFRVAIADLHQRLVLI